ncbi:MAG: hypothetical protein P9L97_09435 [Candidatus Tenebribacter davisii]|nr:hypothetical protein [Candidatus Tenebribacter davisii]
MDDNLMKFSLKGFNDLNLSNPSFLPKNFFPYIRLDKRSYSKLEKLHEKSGVNIKSAFNELKKRAGEKYFHKVYPSQSSALSFSQRSFPAYRFLLPEVLADDWLGIVDFHKKHSRDHALHQPLTAYIVYELLGGGDTKESLKINDNNLLDLCIDQLFCSPKMEYIKEYLLNLGVVPDNVTGLHDKKNNYSREFWKNLFLETAVVAAIFHDIGYPWQYINQLNHSLSASDFSPSNLNSNSRFILNTFRDRLILYPFNGYKSLTKSTPGNWEEKLLELISSSITSTHGFPGALSFLYLNDIIREFPSKTELPFNQFCIEWAALGIMMHDMKSTYNEDNGCHPENGQMRLEFDRDPLSCIITLADVLEEFERPNVDITPHKHSSNFRYNYSCISSELSLEKSTLNINYKYEDGIGVANKMPFLKTDEKEYFDPDYGYLDFSSIGINKVKLHATC